MLNKIKEGKCESFPQNSDFLMNYHFADYVYGSNSVTMAHWHEHVELLCVVQGELNIHIRGEKIKAVSGDIIVINPGEIHAILEKDADTVYECLIPYNVLCSRMSIPIGDVLIKNHIRDLKYTEWFHSIINELREQPPLYKVSVQTHLLSLLISLMQKYTAEVKPCHYKKNSKKEDGVKKAIEYLKQNYTNPISTKEVGEYLGYNATYVCHAFKEITGNTISDYFNMIRCEHAREILLEGKVSIADCARQCGFNHMSYFTKTYRQHIGERPSDTVKKR